MVGEQIVEGGAGAHRDARRPAIVVRLHRRCAAGPLEVVPDARPERS